MKLSAKYRLVFLGVVGAHIGALTALVMPACDKEQRIPEPTWTVECLVANGPLEVRSARSVRVEQGVVHIEDKKGEHYFVASDVCHATPEIVGFEPELLPKGAF